VEFVDLTRTHGIVVKKSHRPAERTFVGAKLGVKTFFALSHELLGGVLRAAGFGVEWDGSGLKAGLVVVVGSGSEVVLVVGAGVTVFVAGGAGANGELRFLVILDDGIIADVCYFGTLGSGTLPEERTCGMRLAELMYDTF